jgi:hypothetical protein
MPVSRRAFLKLGGSLLIAGPLAGPAADRPEWMPGARLGRMTESRIRLYSRPHPDGREVAFKFRDGVVTIVAKWWGLSFYPHNHAWFETPDG